MKIIASNFKMNHTRNSTRKYLEKLDNFLSISGIKEEIFIFPPYSALDKFNLESNITIGAQNGFYEVKGSYTGEIGLEQLNEFDINAILIGHSERRHILNESQETIAKKFNFYKKNNFKIIYCVGEKLEIKQQGVNKTLEYIYNQFEGIDLNYENLIIAYEPVWAIGTGVSATIEDISNIHNALKQNIKAPILYGGSVKVNNIEDILKVDSVDGVLIGTASWEVENFIQMIKTSYQN